MALDQAGLQLIAQGAAAYIADVQRAASAGTALGNASIAAAQKVQRHAQAIDHLNTEINLQKRQFDILAQELVQASAKYGANSTQAQKLDLSLQKLATSIQKNENELRDEQQSLTAAEKEMRQAATATAKFEDETKQASGALTSFQQIGVGALRKIGEIAVDGLGQAASAVAGFFRDAITESGNFEQGLNVLQAVTGATDAQMQQMSDTAIALGNDIALPGTSAQDAATAMTELAKAGLSTQDAMDAARGTLLLATAAETDAATAAGIVAGALNAFHLEGAKAAMVADQLAAGANASAASITDLSQGFRQAGFMFSATGQKTDDLIASLSILTNVGLTGSDAGTALKNAMTRLVGPTDKAAKLMQQLGINVYDANGNMLPMRDIIGVLNRALGGMNAQQRNAALSTIFLSDGMKSMIPLLDAGVAGFDEMKAKVDAAGQAQALASAQTAGFNGALAALGNALDTLKLIIGTKLLPALTPMLNMFAAGVSALGDFVSATADGKTVISDIARIISQTAIPALVGLAAATTAYGIATMAAATGGGAQIGIALALVAQRAILAASALASAAGAAALAALPFVAIGAAVAVVTLKFNEFNKKIADATTQLLNSREWWTASEAALKDYATQTGATKDALSPLAASISAMRDQIQSEVESLGKRMAAGTVSQAQYQAELNTINQHRVGLQQATDAYNLQEQALIKQATAQLNATTAMQGAVGPLAAVGSQANLTMDDIEKLTKALEDIYTKGAEAVQNYATTYAEFSTGVEARATEHKDKITALETEKQNATTDEQRKGIDARIAKENEGYATEEQNQAASYARQQGQQRQHLGQMLIDYTVNQAELGNISKATAAAITDELAKQYGLQENNVASTFLRMAGSIDEFAASGSADVNKLTGTLEDQQHQAADTQMAMDRYAKQYTATAVANFLEKKADAAAYISELERIPARVVTNVVTNYSHTGDRDTTTGTGSAYGGGHAAGGPVAAGVAYLVGEKGPELFIPDKRGSIIPNNVFRPVKPMMNVSNLNNVSNATNYSNTTNLNMPIYTNQSASVLKSSLAIAGAALP